MMRRASLLLMLAALSGCGDAYGGAASREQIRAVGSSTVYPFAKAVAESLARGNPAIKSPIIEAVGTGAGINLFCGGVGTEYPDIATASRRIKKSEYEGCLENGVKDLVEIQVGLDGIAFAEANGGPKLELTPADAYRALAANPFGKPQTARLWSDVNPKLPAIPILVYGPPATSGTRDALAELVMTKGCDSDPAMKALKDSDKDKHKKICTGVRSDGAFVDSGENDNLIVQKIAANPRAIGVFGFSFLEENMDKLRGVPMSGVAPTYATISDFSYPGARPLYIYVKAAHLPAIRGLREYAAEFARAWGPEGYLKRHGMVVAPDAVRSVNAGIVQAMTPIDPRGLK